MKRLSKSKAKKCGLMFSGFSTAESVTIGILKTRCMIVRFKFLAFSQLKNSVAMGG
jgi:hypothetical protein